MHVPRSNKIEAFFLTPDGLEPRSCRFKAISWRLVADVFEAFAEEAKPPMVRLFAQQWNERSSELKILNGFFSVRRRVRLIF